MKAFKTLKYAFYILYAFIFMGFLFHKSSNPALGPYSLEHIVFLCVLSLGFFIPAAFKFASEKYGRNKVGLGLATTIAVFILVYVAGSFIYYNTRFHPFDPFLQMPPPEINPDQFKKEDDTIRIITLGGSTTQNGGLPYKEKYPTVLLKSLKEKYPEKNIELFNAGMMWYTTRHSLINYTTSIKDWKPDVAIIMHGINDLTRSCEDENFTIKPYNRLWSHFYGPSVNGAKPITFEKWLSRPFLNIWYSSLKKTEADLPLDYYKSQTDFKRNLRSLVQYLKADGVTPAIMTQPYLYKTHMSDEEESKIVFGESYCRTYNDALRYSYPSAKSLKYAMDSFNNGAREVAESEDVLLIDAEPAIPKNLEHFRDDVHYTKKGAELLAETASDTIVEQRVLDNISD